MSEINFFLRSQKLSVFGFSFFW